MSEQNGHHYADHISKYFLSSKMIAILQKFNPRIRVVCIDFDSCSANRPQAIVQINEYPIHWRVYASTGLNVFYPLYVSISIPLYDTGKSGVNDLEFCLYSILNSMRPGDVYASVNYVHIGSDSGSSPGLCSAITLTDYYIPPSGF